MEDLAVVLAGEVDAGKSTLIGRFLYEMGSVTKETTEELRKACQKLETDFEFAYLLDSFEEERRNQLTIDTTQIFCKAKLGKGFLFIDVPGHRQLLKNMLCGSSYAEAAIVVIDAGKSIEEATKTHINVLRFLGIEQIIVALNKIDLVNFNEGVFIQAKKKIAEFFNRIGIQPEYIIPLSAKEGENLVKKSPKMPWYKGMPLLEALNRLNKRFKKEICDFYFPIQDVYCIDGEKVYVGNIISGKIKRKEAVKILPQNLECKVKKIKVFDKIKPKALAEQSIGLVLTGPDSLGRGQIIYRGRPPQVANQISAKIFCVHPLGLEDSLFFKCATQETPAKISRINKIFDTPNLEIGRGIKNIKEAEAAEVVINTEKPVVIKKFHQLQSLGRFVLENNKEICAAGIVL